MAELAGSKRGVLKRPQPVVPSRIMAQAQTVGVYTRKSSVWVAHQSAQPLKMPLAAGAWVFFSQGNLEGPWPTPPRPAFSKPRRSLRSTEALFHAASLRGWPRRLAHEAGGSILALPPRQPRHSLPWAMAYAAALNTHQDSPLAPLHQSALICHVTRQPGASARTCGAEGSLALWRKAAKKAGSLSWGAGPRRRAQRTAPHSARWDLPVCSHASAYCASGRINLHTRRGGHPPPPAKAEPCPLKARTTPPRSAPIKPRRSPHSIRALSHAASPRGWAR